MKKKENPYKECEFCKTLTDCPHPDVAQDLMSLPMIPDCCPKPIDVMKATLKQNKVRHNLIRNN